MQRYRAYQKKPGKSAKIMLQQPDKNSKKIFADRVKPFGHKHLPLSIVDIMLNNPGHPYTISALRRVLYSRKKFSYSLNAIQSCINCLADMQHITLVKHRVTRGRNTRVQAFTITIKPQVEHTLFNNSQTNIQT